MELKQVKGNTWVLEGEELIPLYRLDGGRCILLDTGLREEREALEEALNAAGLTPAGILCSHAHVDHCANNGYFQEKCGAKVALTYPEAGMCSSLLTLNCYFLNLSPGMIEREAFSMIHTPDVLIPPSDGPFGFCGVEFQIIHTPGHSCGHVCIITPDNVCYTGDALLSGELLQRAKLPYNLSHQAAMDSREKLRGLDCDAYIMAHRGVCSAAEVDALIEENQALLLRRAAEICALVDRTMTSSEVNTAVCAYYKLLTRQPRNALRYDRNLRYFIEFLLDRGELVTGVRDGVVCCGPAK